MINPQPRMIARMNWIVFIRGRLSHALIDVRFPIFTQHRSKAFQLQFGHRVQTLSPVQPRCKGRESSFQKLFQRRQCLCNTGGITDNIKNGPFSINIRASENPKGIPAPSPRLLGTSYFGSAIRQIFSTATRLWLFISSSRNYQPATLIALIEKMPQKEQKGRQPAQSNQ